MNRLNALLERVSRAARRLPGAVELYLFGSANDPALKDAYSDLDLQVVSADYELSRAYWPWILELAGDISLVCPIIDKPRESAFWVVFSGESHYHKVDAGLSDSTQEQGFIHNIQHKTLLWRQAPPASLAVPLQRAAWMPEASTPLHFLTSELLGSVRYVKARRRGQHLTCWRFISGRLNALLRSYQWDGRSQRFPQTPLSTWDYAALDRLLPESDRLHWLALVDCRTPCAMDQALVTLTRCLVERICPDWASDDTPAGQHIRDIFSFIAQELAGREGAKDRNHEETA